MTMKDQPSFDENFKIHEARKREREWSEFIWFINWALQFFIWNLIEAHIVEHINPFGMRWSQSLFSRFSHLVVASFVAFKIHLACVKPRKQNCEEFGWAEMKSRWQPLEALNRESWWIQEHSAHHLHLLEKTECFSAFYISCRSWTCCWRETFIAKLIVAKLGWAQNCVNKIMLKAVVRSQQILFYYRTTLCRCGAQQMQQIYSFIENSTGSWNKTIFIQTWKVFSHAQHITIA